MFVSKTLFSPTPPMLNVSVSSQATGNAKSTIGKDIVHEMVVTTQLTTDEDGSLKIKYCEEFVDSKSYLEFFKAVQEAKAGEHSASAA